MSTSLRALFKRRAPAAPSRVSCDSEGLTVISHGKTQPAAQKLRWIGVSSVIAYKKDCLTVDQIRVEIYPQDGDGLLITEDFEGFADFTEALPIHLGEVPGDWYLTLEQTPAFDPTFHVLLKR